MNRWSPSRAGILNVWRFHDETFTFHNGRLLLRGPNGAGKSKALELLLPHLLDAEIADGMHWNLMGESEDGIRAGFAWLEFQRDDEWFTCGVRLQASTNTSEVQASYFTTTRRIGDLLLVNEAGRPLTRVNLARAIGAYGEVHGSVAGYRAKLRELLFTGMTEEQHGALTTLLRRQTEPEELLSGLLPRVDAPVSGFERLERQRAQLQQVVDAVEVTATLVSQLGAHARKALHDAEASLKAADGHVAELSRAAGETEQQYREQHQSLAEVVHAEEQLNREAGELDSRLDKTLYGKRLEELRQRLAAARTRAENAAKHAAELRALADEDTQLAENAFAVARSAVDAASTSATEAQEVAWRAGMSPVFEELLANPDRGLLGAAVDTRARQIGQARQADLQHEIAREIRDRAQERLDEERAALDQAEAEETQSAQALEAAQVRLKDDLSAWASECRELEVDPASDVNEAAGQAREYISRIELQLEERREALARQFTQYTTLRDKLAKQIVPPPAPHTRDADRATMTGAPLWWLVEFRPHMPLNLCAAIEAALEASGLLDAWVTPDPPRLLDHDAFADEALAAPTPGASLLDVLVPEGHAAYRILEGIAFGESAPDHPAAVGADGTWRLGSLRGQWAKPEPVYIGSDAREHAAERRVAELTTLIDKVQTDIDEADATGVQIAGRRDALARELASVPSRDAVDEAVARHTNAQVRCAVLHDAVTRTRQHLNDAETRVAQAKAALDAATTDHELDAVTAFRSVADQWLDDQREARAADQVEGVAAARAATSRGHADEAERVVAAQLAEEEELAAALQANPDEVDQLRARREEITAALDALRTRRSDLERFVGPYREKHAADETKRQEAAAVRDAAEERLRRLSDTDLPDSPEAPTRSLTHAVEDAQLVLGSRVELTLNPDDVQLVVALDRKQVSPSELLDWVRAHRDRMSEQLATAEHELFDRTLTPDMRTRIADQLRTADEVLSGVNEWLEPFGVRITWQGGGEARDVLLANPPTPTDAERAVLQAFFRDRQVADGVALDCRSWQRLVVQVDRGAGWQPFTKRTRDGLSSGEHAMVWHVLHAAAVAAHYPPDAPRLLVLDDVFTGVDAANRGRLVELLVDLELDLLLTSDQDWFDYRELPGIAVHQLMASEDAVTSVRFTWDGA